MAEAFSVLHAEMKRLGVTRWLFSSNVPRRERDGAPYSNQGMLSDPGVAVYFELKGRKCSLACDKWLRVEDNAWAIAKHIEALRGQERWGVGSVEQAFRGYMALPAVGESSGSDWWKTLGVPINATAEQVREAFRILVKKHHPDTGGDAEMFRRITHAMDQFDITQRNGAQK